MAKLTKNVVERPATNGKPYFIFDDQLSGFCARIAPNGKRHYYVQYMLSKQTKRLPLGLHGIITAEKAREKAIIALAQVKEGRDPQVERKEKLREATVRDLAEHYYEEHAKYTVSPTHAPDIAATLTHISCRYWDRKRFPKLIGKTLRMFITGCVMRHMMPIVAWK